MPHEVLNPDSLAAPRGYSHGIKGEGRLLFIGGQVGWDREGRFVAADMTGQFAQALDNVLEVVRAAGGGPEHVVRMALYVTDKQAYVRDRKELGIAWRARMGRHYPAMVLLEVKSLLADEALVEIEATALL